MEKNFTFSWDIVGKKYDNFTDLGHYVLLADEVTDFDLDKMLHTIKVHTGEEKAGCTCVAKIANNGDMILGRNMDIELRQFPAIITPTSFGKYRTVNVSYMFTGPWTYQEVLQSGHLDEEYRHAVPFAATDVFNECGLYIQTNMRVGDPRFKLESSAPGRQSVPWTVMPALACANCATVEEALEYIRHSYNYYIYANDKSELKGWGFGFMLADGTGKYGLLEMVDGDLHFTPYQFGQANYYITPKYNARETYGCGQGRLAFVDERLFLPQTKESMLELVGKIAFSKEVLNPQFSYRDERGKIQFVDQHGRPVCDWRSDYSKSLFIADDGSVSSTSPDQAGHDAYVAARAADDQAGMAQNQAAFDKYERELARCTTSWCEDDANFEAMQKAVVEKCKDDVELLQQYFEGNEDPIRNNGKMWTSSLSFGVNCTDRSFILKMWENDQLRIQFKW